MYKMLLLILFVLFIVSIVFASWVPTNYFYEEKTNLGIQYFLRIDKQLDFIKASTMNGFIKPEICIKSGLVSSGEGHYGVLNPYNGQVFLWGNN